MNTSYGIFGHEAEAEAWPVPTYPTSPGKPSVSIVVFAQESALASNAAQAALVYEARARKLEAARVESLATGSPECG